MNFQKSPFVQDIKIPQTCQIIFVSDFFKEDLIGGAELTTDALITSSPYEVFRLKSKDVSMKTLEDGYQKHWIFGNATALNQSLIPTIVANISYSVVEYDFKYCRARSPEKHRYTTNLDCDCHEQVIGKTISAFFHGAKNLFWMSEKQQNLYFEHFPFLRENNNIVLSSVFDKNTLAKIRLLRENIDKKDKKGWLVYGSDSWIKGTKDAIDYCSKNNLEYSVIKDSSYDDALAKISSSEGIVYLPPGSDTCPRFVIEAKLLNCKLVTNQYVLHRDEEWFKQPVKEVEEYLLGTPDLFWKYIGSTLAPKTLSGYTTTYNCLSQDYPFDKTIENMLQFCDEVCVADGGSTDGTIEKLFDIAWPTLNKEKYANLLEMIKSSQDWESKYKEIPDPRIRIKVIPRDWNSKTENYARYDGIQKAEARSLCTKDFCWQMDSDEIVDEKSFEKIKDIMSALPSSVKCIGLPVVEYWGSYSKVRADVQPWKWRLSKNDPDITHGAPKDFVKIVDGKEILLPGTDGCDMISKTTGERIPFVNFHNEKTESLRQVALTGDEGALKQYEMWFNEAVKQLPVVHHYSWIDIERKIQHYKAHWTKFWLTLWNKDTSDTAEHNMFFDCPWSEVTDDMIKEKAKELSENTGGWIFHQKWKGQTLPHIKISDELVRKL